MTLNDNPRVDAERRYKILSKRQERFRRIVYYFQQPKDLDLVNHGWDYNRAVWDVHRARVARLRSAIDTELAAVKRVLRAFDWNG